MPAKILDGKGTAEKIRKVLKEKIAKLDKKPCLAVIQVGNNPASSVYINIKSIACEDVGIISKKIHLKEDATEKELLAKLMELRGDDSVNGILVQLPLPKHINEYNIIKEVCYHKDVDGFNPINVGKYTIGKNAFVPCTPKGVIRLLDEYKIPVEGKNAVVVGRSNIVGRPLSILLLNRGATVTVCHSRTKDLAYHTKQADILVVAVGKPGLITKDMVKKGAVVVDVGTTKVDGKLKGDVDFENVKEVASYITPVPKGVGPMTVAMLLENTLQAYELQGKKESGSGRTL